MKNSLIFTLALAVTACSSTSDPEKLVLRLMESKFSEVTYTVTKQDGIIYFDETGENGGLSGSYKFSDDYLIIAIDYWGPDMSGGVSTGLFINENKEWLSLLPEDLINGEYDTLIDLNKDQKIELIVNEHYNTGAGSNDTYVLYALVSGKKFEKVQTIACFSDGPIDSYSENNKRISGELSFEESGDKILIAVNENHDWINAENGEIESELVSYKFKWTPPDLVRIDDVTTGSSPDNLVISGKDIWVRDEPGTGKVVMKLNEGDQCKVIGRGEQYEIIHGQADYWYQIEFNGQKGWVFGSQTSMKKEDESREFTTLDEVVTTFTFNSNDDPNWEGDASITSCTGKFEENGFAVVSFNTPGFMLSGNFSWVGFQGNDKWTTYQFPGEALKIIHKNDKLFLLMFIKSTGGAFTLANDYVLYAIDPAKKSFTRQQIIFEFANDFIEEENIYGEATLKFPDDNDEVIEITETIDHEYTGKRKGSFITTYSFDYESMSYKKIK